MSNCTQISNNRRSDSQRFSPAILDTLLFAKDYFTLRTRLQTNSKGLDEKARLYYNAFVLNAFNKNDSSRMIVDSLLNLYGDKLDDSLRLLLLELQQSNYTRLFQYANAYAVDKKLLSYYHDQRNSIKTAEIQNQLIIDSGLTGISPLHLEVARGDTIRWKENKLGIIEIPVTRNKTIYPLVFDTRASISVVSATIARKMHLKILPVTFIEHSGITGNGFSSGLAVADSLYIGKTLIKNAIFQVLPDSILYFSEINFSIGGAIGLPIIRELKYCTLYQNGIILFTGSNRNKTFSNLALDGTTAIIELISRQDTLPFHFDLGASSTALYDSYFKKYKDDILKTGSIQYREWAGAGGTQRRQVYTLPHFFVTIAGKEIGIDSVDVFTKPIYPGQKFYGNIGQDLVKKFSSITLDFQSMCVDFR